jgi:hypothetical protein
MNKPWGTSHNKKTYTECIKCCSTGKYGGKGLCCICYNKKNGKIYRKINKKRHAIQSLISYHKNKCLNAQNVSSQMKSQSVIS